MKEGLIKDAYELILKEIQTVITILYLLMVGIGMLFNYKKYARFGINIFDYADVFDFLVTPFQDIRIILVSIITLFFPIGIFWLGIYLKSKFPRFYSIINFGLANKSWYRKFKLVLFAMFLFYVLVETANGYGNYIKNNIDLSQSVSVKYANDELLEGKLIGKSKEVIFLYTENKVKIIPITSLVKEIELN
ncbi:MAG: hypothetical protein HKO81_05915 [Flavobacteriaceae bacterium]|nr:hypothetical protein [Flavobacteriaceae bacterium]